MDRGKPADAAYVQAGLFAFEYSLAKAHEEATGLTPHVVMGHSFGELVACCAAGVLSLEHGLHIAVMRGRLMSEASFDGCGMVAVFASEARVREALQRVQSGVPSAGEVSEGGDRRGGQPSLS